MGARPTPGPEFLEWLPSDTMVPEPGRCCVVITATQEVWLGEPCHHLRLGLSTRLLGGEKWVQPWWGTCGLRA